MNDFQTPPQEHAPQPFDLIVVGGGIAGLLTVHRYLTAKPDQKVLLVEKESRIGGRLATYDGEHRGCGFQSISPKLYEFWNQAIKTDPEAEDLPSLISDKQVTAGVLLGNKLMDIPITDLYSEKGARALGGLAAQREWPKVNEILANEETRFETTFAEAWKGPRKSPSTLVLENYALACGITDIWESSPGTIYERSELYRSEPFSGDWKNALAALVQKFVAHDQLTILTEARAFDAEFHDDQWTLRTAKGTFLSTKLLVAQPPWTASQWLPKKLWPPQLLTVLNKTKPVSLVTLSCPVVDGDTTEIPQLITIPSEQIQVVLSPKELVFQATIDFESSLQAPDVVKAVKRLKRAHKKLLAAIPEIKTGVERVALVPVGWAQSSSHLERKHLDKLKMNSVQEHHLAFCGDAYGRSLDGDRNLMESIISANEALHS